MASNAKKQIGKGKVEETKRSSRISFRASSLRKKHRKGKLRAKNNRLSKCSKKVRRGWRLIESRPKPSFRQEPPRIIFAGEVGLYGCSKLRGALDECDFDVPVELSSISLGAGIRKVTLEVDTTCIEAFRRELYESTGNLFPWHSRLKEVSP